MLRRRTAPDPSAPIVLHGRRVLLRPLASHDFEQWREVRRRCNDWLVRWEPRRDPSQPDTVESRQAFGARCSVRTREIQLGTGYGFGIFVDGAFAGEVNVNSIHRGAHQSAYVGYWVDERLAGRGYMPESVVVVLRLVKSDIPTPATNMKVAANRVARTPVQGSNSRSAHELPGPAIAPAALR